MKSISEYVLQRYFNSISMISPSIPTKLFKSFSISINFTTQSVKSIFEISLYSFVFCNKKQVMMTDDRPINLGLYDENL